MSFEEQKAYIFEILDSLNDISFSTARYLLCWKYKPILHNIVLDVSPYLTGFYLKEEIFSCIEYLKQNIDSIVNWTWYPSMIYELQTLSYEIEQTTIIPIVQERWHSLFVMLGITHRTVALDNQLQVIL